MRQQLRDHRIQFGPAQAFETLDFDGLRIEHVCIVRGQLSQRHRCIFVLLFGRDLSRLLSKYKNV
jgi:hypothetical protein